MILIVDLAPANKLSIEDILGRALLASLRSSVEVLFVADDLNDQTEIGTVHVVLRFADHDAAVAFASLIASDGKLSGAPEVHIHLLRPRRWTELSILPPVFP